ncbi:MAG: Gx transporter family protein [Clostridia bacterium]|nr:Gx transporter family protein [Clostridia bacterium]
MRYRRLTSCALLTAVALSIFVIEAQFPVLIPIPGIKPGLSNIITLFALLYLTPGETALILLSRILLGSLFVGNPVILLYSLTGGLCCLFVELCICKIAPIPALSAVGAMVHNTVQLLVAALVTGTFAVFCYLPILLIAGIITGLFTGFCLYFLNRSCEKTLKRIFS